jgi:hypothetical protein
VAGIRPSATSPSTGCVITYDGVPTCSVSVMEMADGLVTHETQYFADPFPAAPGRAALAEPIPARED